MLRPSRSLIYEIEKEIYKDLKITAPRKYWTFKFCNWFVKIFGFTSVASILILVILNMVLTLTKTQKTLTTDQISEQLVIILIISVAIEILALIFREAAYKDLQPLVRKSAKSLPDFKS